MQRLTIAERLIVVALLPLLICLLAALVGGSMPDGGAFSLPGTLAFTVAIAVLAVGTAVLVARSLRRPLVEADEIIGAMVRAELDSMAPEIGGRTEIERLMAHIDKLDEALRERHRRELLLLDADRKRQTDRRINLSNMASQIEDATEGGMRSIVDGSFALRAKADDVRMVLESVRAASDETARAAESSRTMNHEATRYSEQIIVAIAPSRSDADRSRAVMRFRAPTTPATSSMRSRRQLTTSERSSR